MKQTWDNLQANITQEEALDCLLADNAQYAQEPWFIRTLYLDGIQIVPMVVFREEWAQDAIQRYHYSQQYPAVPPYPGSFDEQPAVWVDQQNLIRHELQIIQESKNGA